MRQWMVATLGCVAFCAAVNFTPAIAAEPIDQSASVASAKKTGVKRAIREWVADLAPQATAAQARDFGLHLPAKVDPGKSLVILLHGLDCDIADCRPLADRLIADGHQVARFGYPDDQSIADSAALFAKHMLALRETFPSLRVDLVAYSMGGLVARAYVESDACPANSIDRMILLAPPNHGSKWSKLAVLLEAQEHWKLLRHRAEWSPTWMITDGLGEAACELSPDSEFLSGLNARPRRADVKYTIVTGNRHPLRRYAAACVGAPAGWIPDRLSAYAFPKSCQNFLIEQAESIRSKVCGGDGAVSAESAKLDGVDDVVILPADHTTLFFSHGDCDPVAWDTIRQRLAN